MININYFGSIKNKQIKKLINYYKQLSSRNLKINMQRMKEVKSSNIKEKKKKELNKLRKKIIKDKNYTFVLDYRGRILTTEKFAEKIDSKLKHGKHVSFYIGNYYGIDENTL
ncbi:MAG: 23S rRNA (pseudouridine(1915)-N(3))-methyltransferase RlmH, partial [Candidatus Mcinerneyibacterium aminivorans]